MKDKADELRKQFQQENSRDDLFTVFHVKWLEQKLIDQQSKEEARVVPYQTCPKCNGQGSVSKPPYVPGDVHQWSSTSINFICDVCNGAKIIPMHSGIDD